MCYKRNILLVFVLLMCITAAHATGPSYIYSEIRPISINKEGGILCRIRFAKNKMGSTSLHYAMIYENDIDTIKLLLEKGADINTKKITGRTMLKHAKDENIKQLLRKHGAKE